MKRKFVPIDYENRKEILEKFINGETDLYLFLRQIEGVTNLKSRSLVRLGVTGYCKLTEYYRVWDLFILDPGKVILQAKLEIVEPEKIYARTGVEHFDWDEEKKDNFFIPLSFNDPSEAAQNTTYGVFSNRVVTNGKIYMPSYNYSVKQELLLLERKMSNKGIVLPCGHDKIDFNDPGTQFLDYFDWVNFYSEKNSRLIEKLLKLGVISLLSFVQLIYPKSLIKKSEKTQFDKYLNFSEDQIVGFFAKKIDGWDDGRISYIKELGAVIGGQVDINSVLPVDLIFSMLIQDDFLPSELCRLPRLHTKNTKIILDYYSHFALENSIDEILYSRENFVEEMPLFYTYEQLKNKCVDVPDNIIDHYCLTGKLIPYLVIRSEFVVSSKENSSHLCLFQELNCGNSSYLKRYKGLERLKLDDKNYSFDLETLFSVGHLDLKKTLVRYLDATEMESKLHITRRLKSYNGKNLIKKEDLVFLKNDIDRLGEVFIHAQAKVNLIFESEAIESPEICRENNKKLEIEANLSFLEGQNEEALLSPKAHNPENNKESCLDKLKSKIECLPRSHGNKAKSIAEGLRLIFEAIKTVDKNFDPNEMPGNVKDFHLFCANICEKLFPIDKSTFHKYCKAKNLSEKTPPFCKWKEGHSPNKDYWDDILLKLKNQ